MSSSQAKLHIEIGPKYKRLGTIIVTIPKIKPQVESIHGRNPKLVLANQALLRNQKILKMKNLGQILIDAHRNAQILD